MVVHHEVCLLTIIAQPVGDILVRGKKILPVANAVPFMIGATKNQELKEPNLLSGTNFAKGAYYDV